MLLAHSRIVPDRHIRNEHHVTITDSSWHWVPLNCDPFSTRRTLVTDVYHSCYDRYHYRDDYCNNATDNRPLGYIV